MSNILDILFIDKNKVIKQGDNTVLSYHLKTNNHDVNITSGTAKAVLIKDKTIAYTTTAQVNNGVATFKIDKVLPADMYLLEIIIGDKHIFPSDRRATITITTSSDNLAVDLVENYGIDKLKEEIIKEVGTGGVNIDGLLKAEDAKTLYAPKVHLHSQYALGSALANYALKDHTHENYVTQEQLAQVSLGGEVDLSGYVSKTELADKGYLTSIPDEYVTDTELSGKGYLTIETFTQTQADELYQSKGNYATKEELANVSSGGSVDLSGYAKRSELSGYLTKTTAESTYQPKGNYLTSIPNEYVTETELQQHLGDINTILAKVVGVI